ncbi:MAG: DUF4835 family protein [Bacteroidia bacterium]|nr:MAG: DUF4835 family protein [Bacteroidia bacterium]
MMKKLIFLIGFGLTMLIPSTAQELNIQVSVSTPGMSETERLVMQTLRSELREFINQTNWTAYQFETRERIEGSIQITIEERAGGDEYRGSIQVQSRRPVYNTAYNTPVFNHRDRDFEFRYREHQPLEYAENAFLSNLTSVIAYYVYIIIGFDFDTFAPLGGNPYFEAAQQIVNQAQNAPQRGWKSFESQRNRYWLVENLMNPRYRQIRQAMYRYHRLGFDTMTDNIDLGRSEVLGALEMLQRAHRERPGIPLMQVVMTAKSDELVNLFSEAPGMEQNRAIEILSEIDPANSSKYRRIADRN